MTLYQKLNLANTSPAELNVLLGARLTQLPLYHAFHFTDRIKCTEIEILTIDKGPEHRQKCPATFTVTRHQPCLDQRISLPGPAVGLVVMLHGGKRQDQWPTVAIRA